MNDRTQPLAGKLLAMVHELHKAGYQRLRIAPGMAPSGLHWRCAITVAANVGSNGWEPIDWDDLTVTYSTAEGGNYFGWNGGDMAAEAMAQKFLATFPAICQASAGLDCPYTEWLATVVKAAEQGYLPVLFADYPLRPDELPPPPVTADTMRS